jgi:hypothetical protein
MAESNRIDIIIRAVDETKAAITSIKDGLNGLSTVLGGFGVAWLSWQGATKLFDATIAAAGASQEAYHGLEMQLQRNGIAWSNVGERLKDYALRQQALTTFTDEQTVEALKLASFHTTNLANATDLVTAAQDMAVARGVDLTTTTNILGRAYEGVGRGLALYGLHLDTTLPKQEMFRDLLEQVHTKNGGAAQAELETWVGQWKQFKNTIGEIGENIGMVFIPAMSATLLDVERLTAGLSYLGDQTDENAMKLKIADKAYEDFAAHDKARSIAEQAIAAANSATLDKEIKQLQVKMNLTNEIHDIMAGTGEGFVGPKPLSQEQEKAIEDAYKDIFDKMDKSAKAWLDYNLKLLDDWKADMVATGASVVLIEKSYQSQRTKLEKEHYDAVKALSANDVKKRFDDLQKFLEHVKTLEEKHYEDRVAEAQSLYDKQKQFLDDIEAEEKAHYEKRTAAELAALKEEERKIMEAENFMRSQAQLGTDFIISQFTTTRMKLADLFNMMALDFLRLFIDRILEHIAIMLVPKLLKLLALFDVHENDMMAMRIGEDYAKYFTIGVTNGIGNANLGKILSGSIGMPSYSMPSGGAIVININNPIGTEDYIVNNIVPALQKVTRRSQSYFMMRDMGILKQVAT